MQNQEQNQNQNQNQSVEKSEVDVAPDSQEMPKQQPESSHSNSNKDSVERRESADSQQAREKKESVQEAPRKTSSAMKLEAAAKEANIDEQAVPGSRKNSAKVEKVLGRYSESDSSIGGQDGAKPKTGLLKKLKNFCGLFGGKEKTEKKQSVTVTEIFRDDAADTKRNSMFENQQQPRNSLPQPSATQEVVEEEVQEQKQEQEKEQEQVQETSSQQGATEEVASEQVEKKPSTTAPAPVENERRVSDSANSNAANRPPQK